MVFFIIFVKVSKNKLFKKKHKYKEKEKKETTKKDSFVNTQTKHLYRSSSSDLSGSSLIVFIEY